MTVGQEVDQSKLLTMVRSHWRGGVTVHQPILCLSCFSPHRFTSTPAANVPMVYRILSLLLGLLVAGPMSVPVRALARSETRVGGGAEFSSVLASPSASQVGQAHQESLGCAYDFASGVHKYLYCHANPVNRMDPSGNFTLLELNTTTAKALVIGWKVVNTTANLYFGAKNVGAGLRSLYAGRPISGGLEVLMGSINLGFGVASAFSSMPPPPAGGVVLAVGNGGIAIALNNPITRKWILAGLPQVTGSAAALSGMLVMSMNDDDQPETTSENRRNSAGDPVIAEYVNNTDELAKLADRLSEGMQYLKHDEEALWFIDQATGRRVEFSLMGHRRIGEPPHVKVTELVGGKSRTVRKIFVRE